MARTRFITVIALQVQAYDILNFVTLSLIMSSLGANELTSSIAISDRKLHAGMVDQDPTGP